jgi:hypothetical protein
MSECYEGTGLFYRGDNGGKEVCARDCDPAGKFDMLLAYSGVYRKFSSTLKYYVV